MFDCHINYFSQPQDEIFATTIKKLPLVVQYQSIHTKIWQLLKK